MAIHQQARRVRTKFSVQNGITSSGGANLPRVVVVINGNTIPAADGYYPYRNGPGLSPNPVIEVRYGDKVRVDVYWNGQHLVGRGKVNNDPERGRYFLNKRGELTWDRNAYYNWPGFRDDKSHSSSMEVCVAQG